MSTMIMPSAAIAVGPAGAPDMSAAGAGKPDTRAARAVKDFEALFVETLLQSTGLLKSLGAEGGADGGVANELIVREIARNLAGQLQLDFGRNLGINATLEGQ
jgi:hypothetical protein